VIPNRTRATVEHIRNRQIDCTVDISFVKHVFDRLLGSNPMNVPAQDFIYPLYRILSAIDFMECTQVLSGFEILRAAELFKYFVFPFMTAAEVEGARIYLRPKLDAQIWRGVSNDEAPPWPYIWSTVFGMHEQIAPLVKAWDAQLFIEEPERLESHCPQLFVLGLGGATDVELHMRRLQLKLVTAYQVVTWIAHTEHGCLDLVKAAILETQDSNFVDILGCVEAPEAAAVMVELLAVDDFKQQAIQWLTQFPHHSLKAVLSLVARRSKGFEAAISVLKAWKRTEVITTNLVGEELCKAFYKQTFEPEDGMQCYDDAAIPDWLSKPLSDLKANRTKLPGWINQAGIVPIVIDKRKLAPDHMAAILYACQQNSLTSNHPVVPLLKANVSATYLNRFAWTLFEGWMRDSGDLKEKWVMISLGFLGSDDSALKLAQLIKIWPGESLHQRAKLGLECLRLIGTDAALMQINGIAQGLKFKALRERALVCLQEIALDRQMTSEQLQDRIVPDCGLDEQGNRSFDYGPRQFKFFFDADLKPMVRYADGKMKSDLPPSIAGDDPDLVRVAQADWKLFKKLVRETGKIQAIRLEQAMIAGRRWSAEEFRRLLVMHPLLSHLVRGLVWGQYGEGGKLLSSFRVAPYRTLANITNEEVQLSSVGAIGIVHPLELSLDIKMDWKKIFSNLELLQPFAQVDRPTHEMTTAERALYEINYFQNKVLPCLSIAGILERLGWTRGAANFHGFYIEHYKRYHRANIVAVVRYDGIHMNYLDPTEYRALTHCFFAKGLSGDKDPFDQDTPPLKLNQVDPIVISETLTDLYALMEKAR
jgi:hypothetical protein